MKDNLIILDDAEPTNAVLTQYPDELQYHGSGDSYVTEYAAIGYDKVNRHAVKVYWHFEIARGGSDKIEPYYDWLPLYSYDTLQEDYDWDNIQKTETRDNDVDGYYTTAEVKQLLSISQQRVSQIAARRKWQVKTIGTANLYRAEDVHAEIERRK